MMDQQAGEFVPVPKEVEKQLGSTAKKDWQKVLKQCPMPTLHRGEIISIKGVNFRVTKIKESGRLILQMVPGQVEKSKFEQLNSALNKLVGV